MRILTTFEAKNAFPKVLKLSRRDVVIVTNRGKPVAAIQGLGGAKRKWCPVRLSRMAGQRRQVRPPPATGLTMRSAVVAM